MVRDRGEAVSLVAQPSAVLANESHELIQLLDLLVEKESAAYEQGLSQIKQMIDRLEELTAETLEPSELTQRIAAQYDSFGK